MTNPIPPRLPAGERLRRAGIAAWSLIGIFIVAVAALWALLKVRIILPPLGLALLIIYILNPVVSRLERRGVPRLAGTIGAYVIVLGSFTALILALVPFASNQVESFATQWPEYREGLVRFIESSAAGVEDTFNTNIETAQIECLLGADQTDVGNAPSSARCDEVTRDVRDQVAAQAGRITEIGSSLFEVLIVFVVGPLVALYLLIDLPQLRRDLMSFLPESHRAEAGDLGGKIGAAVGGFFRGQLVVALLVGLLSAAGFRLIGLPFWFVIGGVAGFFNLVPLIGPYIGGTIGFFVGAISGGLSLGIKAALVELVVQQIDNHLISPKVMSRTVNLHSVTVMLALLAGGALAGFWGLLLAVPTVAVAKIVLSHLWVTRVLGEQVTPFDPDRSGAAPSVVPAPAAAPRAEASSRPGPRDEPGVGKASPSTPNP